MLMKLTPVAFFAFNFFKFELNLIKLLVAYLGAKLY